MDRFSIPPPIKRRLRWVARSGSSSSPICWAKFIRNWRKKWNFVALELSVLYLVWQSVPNWSSCRVGPNKMPHFFWYSRGFGGMEWKQINSLRTCRRAFHNCKVIMSFTRVMYPNSPIIRMTNSICSLLLLPLAFWILLSHELSDIRVMWGLWRGMVVLVYRPS